MILVINSKDNVGIALEILPPNKEVIVDKKSIIIRNNISFGHKLALKYIKKNDKIIRYGEVIGVAIEDIKEGAHVHIHNMVGLRGRGDKLHEINGL